MPAFADAVSVANRIVIGWVMRFTETDRGDRGAVAVLSLAKADQRGSNS